MVESGDVLEHPVTRERIVFRKTGRDTNGALFRADAYFQSGAFVAAEHIHPLQEERFEVISGTLRGRVAGKELSGNPGDKFVVPAGTPHTWWNSGDDELHFVAEVRPALRTDAFFETFFGLAQDGKVSRKTGLPNPLRLAMMMHAFRKEIILARPPRRVQAVLFGLLASIGRLLGYEAEYPYPNPRQAQARLQTK